LSEGKPGEKNVCNDAIAIYDYFVKRADVDSGKIIVMGRSSDRRSCRSGLCEKGAGLILVSPYDSLLSVAKELYPFLR